MLLNIINLINKPMPKIKKASISILSPPLAPDAEVLAERFIIAPKKEPRKSAIFIMDAPANFNAIWRLTRADMNNIL